MNEQRTVDPVLAERARRAAATRKANRERKTIIPATPSFDMAALAAALQPAIAAAVDRAVSDRVPVPTAVQQAAIDDLKAEQEKAAAEIDEQRLKLMDGGLSEAEANSILEQRGVIKTIRDPIVQTASGAMVPLTQLDRDGRLNGPHPDLVKAYEERMKTYVPPVLERVYDGVVIPARFADWLDRKASWESIRRDREVTPKEMIALLVRLAWKDDEDRQFLQPGKTGRKQAFDPKQGTWTGAGQGN